MRVKDARQTFLGLWIRLLVEGKSFEVWGGNQLRDFTYIDDVVDALLLSASDEKACGQVYNLGGDPVVSLNDLAKLLVDQVTFYHEVIFCKRAGSKAGITRQYGTALIERETDDGIIIKSWVIKHIDPEQPHPLRKFSKHGISYELHIISHPPRRH